MDQNLLFRWVRDGARRGASTSSLAAAGLARAGRRNAVADVTSCPGAESCKLAVTQSRGLGRVLADHLTRASGSRGGVARTGHQDQRLPERLRPASHRGHRLSGQPAKGRRAARAAVLRDGRRRRRRRRRPRSDAWRRRFRPVAACDAARAAGEACTRISAPTRSRRWRSSGGSSSARSRRCSPTSSALLPDEAEPQDFIDLAEVSAFNPEVMEGECSA